MSRGQESPREFVAETFAGLMAGKPYGEALLAEYRRLGGVIP